MELTERLRKRAKHADTTGQPNCNLVHEAADEIERLREIFSKKLATGLQACRSNVFWKGFASPPKTVA